jgi:hypothetical protein
MRYRDTLQYYNIQPQARKEEGAYLYITLQNALSCTSRVPTPPHTAILLKERPPCTTSFPTAQPRDATPIIQAEERSAGEHGDMPLYETCTLVCMHMRSRIRAHGNTPERVHVNSYIHVMVLRTQMHTKTCEMCVCVCVCVCVFVCTSILLQTLMAMKCRPASKLTSVHRDIHFPANCSCSSALLYERYAECA